MRQILHALSGALYELDDNGDVLVTKDGRSGTFGRQGRWIRGEIRSADPEMCLWVADGPSVPVDARQNRRYMLVDTIQETKW